MKPDQILASLSQLDHQKRPVTLVAIAFFSLVCLSLAGMQGWSVYKAREEQLAAADAATVAMTRALADQLGHALDSADAMLTDLADQLESGIDNDQMLRLSRAMVQRVQRNGVVAELSVYDQNGNPAISSGSATPARFLAAHIARHGADPASAMFISAPVKDAEGTLWLLPVSRRLTLADGSYGGIAVASLRLAQLNAIASELNIGERGALAVALENGTLLMGRPHYDAIGKNVSESEAFSLRRVPPRAVHAHGLEGGTLYSFRRVAGYPLLVTLTRSSDHVLAAWWESAYLSTAGAALLLLLQLWMGIRLYGQIALRDRLEKERRILQKLLVKKSRSLRHQALKDGLTGIANRRQLDTRLARDFHRAINDGTSLAMVILDVDFFKKYNDQHGHPAGDECLKFIAHCVNGGRRRSQDLAARMGGEEFAILLPNTGLRGAIAVAEMIRKTVASTRLTHIDGFPHSVTVSCGVHALIPTAGMMPQELVDSADRALYLAKTSGRNRVRAEGSVPPSRARRFSLVVNK